MAKKNSIDMTQGAILPKFLMFVCPLMLSSMLQLLFNAADVIVVGEYVGDDALAAVGMNSALINLLTNFFIGLSIGANVLTARYIGAKEDKDVKETVHTAMTVAVLSGIFLTIVGVVGARQILIWMHTPAKILPLATKYLRTYFIGMSAVMVYNFGSAILRSVGDTKRPLFILGFSGVINLGLNLLFVISFDLGVVGVGLATVISQVISAVLILICMINEKGAIRLELKELRIYEDKLISIIRIGLPAGIQGTLFAVSNVIIQSSINTFGKTAVAGNSAAMSVEGFVYMAMNACYQGCISFTSQNVGAGKNTRIGKVLFNAELSVIVVGLVFGNLAYFFGEKLLSYYTDEPAVVEEGLGRMAIVSTLYFLCGIMDVLVGSLRGMGYSVVPSIVSIFGACVLRLFWIFTFFKMDRFHSLKWLYITYPMSWVLMIIAHLICYIVIRKKYVKNVDTVKTSCS